MTTESACIIISQYETATERCPACSPRQDLIDIIEKREQLKQALPKSPIGSALSYGINQWKYFDAYLSDGRVELSNILVENAIRPVALGRKNFLFAGSHDAAQWAAVVYSLAATAKLHGCDPFTYFKELLTELPGAMQSEVENFLLPNWQLAADKL